MLRIITGILIFAINRIQHMSTKRKILFLATVLMLCIPVSYAGPDNIAPLARASASSSLNGNTGPSLVLDGRIRIMDRDEWVSGSGMTFWGLVDYPWIRLDWDSPRHINRVVLYDRPCSESHIAGGILHFSDGSSVNVWQIPNDGSPKEVAFPSREVEWIRFEVTDGDGVGLGLSEMEVYPSPEDYKDYVSWVDPFIETTRGRYFFFVTGSQPYGMISAAPLTRNKNQYGGGYNYNSMEILGFPQIHGWMLSGLSLMPTCGGIDPTLGEQGWKSAFRHEGEEVRPGYHRLFLEDHGIWVEQTACDRVSMYRLTYTRKDVSQILLNLGGYLSTSTMTDARVSKLSNTILEGSFNTTGRLWGGPDNVRIFFRAEFDRPMQSLDSWTDSTRSFNVESFRSGPGSTPRREKGWSYHDAPTAGVAANYPVAPGDQVQVKFSISYTSLENARKNMKEECDHWDFDLMSDETYEEWNRWLGKIDVKGGSQAQKIKFYTDLWHVLLGRHKLDDASGDYPDYTMGGDLSGTHGSHTLGAELKVRTLPKNERGEVRFHMYNSDAVWLTQWNLNILWGLAWPEMLDEFSAAFVQMADNGGLLPRGPCAGGYSYIMTACPATPMIVSAYQKGILTKVDTDHAFEVMKRNHGPGGMLEGIHKNRVRGENAGITVEMSFQDWSLAQMALKLGKNKDARFFMKRSEDWKVLFHPDQKLLFPRKPDGTWLHEDPLNGRGWIEANAWQGTWSVSHDIAGLSDLMGGDDTLCKKLNYAFEQAAPDDFVFGYSGGHVSYANQPGCSNAHVFNYAGKPWLSQYWVRRVNEQAYGGITPDKGYGGHDEDQGQMGGVSALMSMGLFSIRGTSSVDPVYEITSPVFDEITIRLDPDYYEGKNFVIKTHHNTVENCYIQKAELNGKPLDRFWFGHDDYARGGRLELWLGPEPNKQWGMKQEP